MSRKNLKYICPRQFPLRAVNYNCCHPEEGITIVLARTKGALIMYAQNPIQQNSTPQYPAQQPPAPQYPAPEYPGQYPYPQQTSISASVWSQQYVQYVPDWSCTNALLQYQAEIDRLHRQLEQKTLKEEELKNCHKQSGLFVPRGLISPTPLFKEFFVEMPTRHHRQTTAVPILKKFPIFASVYFLTILKVFICYLVFINHHQRRIF